MHEKRVDRDFNFMIWKKKDDEKFEIFMQQF
jgi:hypothetical protein